MLGGLGESQAEGRGLGWMVSWVSWQPEYDLDGRRLLRVREERMK